jgi:hypothetical protein
MYNVSARSKVRTTLIDHTASFDFMLFNNAVEQLLHVTPSELKAMGPTLLHRQRCGVLWQRQVALALC